MSNWSTCEDQVVSEVNTFLVTTLDEKPIQKSSNKIAKIGFSLPKVEVNNVQELKRELTDSDGDLVLPRKGDALATNLDEDFMLIEYENETTLGLVGLQVWRGAFLISDFIIHFSDEYFVGKNVVELGSGTGIGAIVASIYAQSVVATDLSLDMKEDKILDLIAANALHNKLFVNSQFGVKPMDFLDLNWTREIQEIIESADVVLAADVIYHVDITEAFINTLDKIINCVNKGMDIFIAMEKRYVFTISDLDTSSPMYSHFMDQMETKLSLSPGSLPKPLQGKPFNISMKIHPLQFPQYFNYERTKELILIHINIEPI